MVEISDMTEYVKDELCDAHKYANKAYISKSDDEEQSKMYIQLAKQQLQHADSQYEMVVKHINDIIDRSR